MYCSKCGAKIPDGAQFCGSCGAKVTPPGGQKAEPPVRAQQAEGTGIQLNTWPMVIDIVYGIILILTLIAANDFSLLLPLAMIASILALAMFVLMIVDIRYLSKIGIRGGWKWSVLIFPLQLFLRAYKTPGFSPVFY